MREWLRVRLGVRTPLEQWNTLYGQVDPLAIPPVDVPVPPSPGEQPTNQPDPSNYKLNNAITNAALTVNRELNLTDAGTFRSLAVDAQTADGPLAIDLSSVPGINERALISIRRAWWDDGSAVNRLSPVILGSLDRNSVPYLENAVGTPFQFAIEGYTLYLLPSPSAAGTLKYMAGASVLAPTDDDDQFDQIPAAYDPSVLYLALVELAKMMPNDVEMRSRAEGFTPDAQEGLRTLSAWFNGGSNEEVEPTLIFDARYMRRFGRRYR
jgi:hypothetical protein